MLHFSSNCRMTRVSSDFQHSVVTFLRSDGDGPAQFFLPLLLAHPAAALILPLTPPLPDLHWCRTSYLSRLQLPPQLNQFSAMRLQWSTASKRSDSWQRDLMGEVELVEAINTD